MLKNLLCKIDSHQSLQPYENRNLVHVRFYIFAVMTVNLWYQAQNIGTDDNTRAVNIFYFFISFLLGFCLLVSFRWGMKYVKLALNICFFRQLMPLMDI